MTLTDEQRVQEEQYRFPYHYLDIGVAKERDLGLIAYRRYLALVASKLEPFQGQRVLDVGCGDGRLGFELRGRNVRYEGIDFSERAIRFARAFSPEWTFHVGKVESLPERAAFDQAVMVEVLEHIPPEDCRAALEGIASVLKPGGRLVVTVPSVLLPVSAKHYRHFDEALLREVLGAVFDVEYIIGIFATSWRDAPIHLVGTITRFGYPLLRKTPAVKLVRRILESECERQITSVDLNRCKNLMAVCRARSTR